MGWLCNDDWHWNWNDIFRYQERRESCLKDLSSGLKIKLLWTSVKHTIRQNVSIVTVVTVRDVHWQPSTWSMARSSMLPRPLKCNGCIDAGACQLSPHNGLETCPCINCLLKMVCKEACNKYKQYTESYYTIWIGGDLNERSDPQGKR